jgi:hypothetical protein
LRLAIVSLMMGVIMYLSVRTDGLNKLVFGG